MTLSAALQGLFIIFIHWVADFLLQTADMATKKSKSNYWLSMHVSFYMLGSLPTVILIWILSHSLINGILWLVVNGVAHIITDFFTSRWTSDLNAKQQYYKPNKYIKYFNFPSFFSVIGLDQVIHYTCLFLTYVMFT